MGSLSIAMNRSTYWIKVNKNMKHLCPLENGTVVATYVVALHILSPATIHGGTRGTYCRPRAYIVAGMIFIPCIYCRRRQYVPKCAPYIVAPLKIVLLLVYNVSIAKIPMLI